MIDKKDLDKLSFQGIGLAFIIFGAIVTAFGLAAWVLRLCGFSSMGTFPFFKVLGAIVIIGLGYIILQLEFLRKK